MTARRICLEAHELMSADPKPKISDFKNLRRRRTLWKNTYERRRRGCSIRRGYSLHFEKDRMRGPSGDLTRMLVEKLSLIHI